MSALPYHIHGRGYVDVVNCHSLIRPMGAETNSFNTTQLIVHIHSHSIDTCIVHNGTRFPKRCRAVVDRSGKNHDAVVVNQELGPAVRDHGYIIEAS